MSDDLDPRLRVRFTAARAKPLVAQFLASYLARLERERHRNTCRLAAACAAGLLLLAWAMPALLALTARLADQMVSSVVVPARHLASAPSGFSVTGWCISLSAGALVLWRTPSLRRRR